jgi:hypothetical protein
MTYRAGIGVAQMPGAIQRWHPPALPSIPCSEVAKHFANNASG